MATQKPISTISYNTEPFLKEKLDAYVKAHIIQAYQYIPHKGEDGDKDHIHLRIEPNKKVDSMVFMEELREYVKGEDKPLGVRPFRPSKEEDWFLYAVHDADYMKLKYAEDKGEKLPYDYHDIRVSEYYDLDTAWIRAKASIKHSSASMMVKIKEGVKPSELVAEGANPFTVNAVYRTMYASDYSRMAAELEKVRLQLHDLENAIDEYGLAIVVDDKGRTTLEKVDCPFTEETRDGSELLLGRRGEGSKQ